MKTSLDRFRGRENDIGFRLLNFANICFSRTYHKVIVRRPCLLPATGPAILVSNHISSIDPMLLQAVSPRLIRWMMAKEYYDFKAMRFVFDTVGVILVERKGRDMAATRAAMRALDEGYVLGVFPEGRIETTRELLPFQSGIGLLALKSRAPVFPVYLDGTQRKASMIQAFLQPNIASVCFGPRLDFTHDGSARHQVEQVTRQIQEAVANLQNSSPPPVRN